MFGCEDVLEIQSGHSRLHTFERGPVGLLRRRGDYSHAADLLLRLDHPQFVEQAQRVAKRRLRQQPLQLLKGLDSEKAPLDSDRRSLESALP